MSDEVEYLLGTQRDELVRLGFQHRVWSATCRDHWARAGFGPGQALLDVGCGPGYAAIDLAYLVGDTGVVDAVDLSQRFIDTLRARARQEGLTNIATRVGAIGSEDLPADRYDGAYARWLLCFVDRPVDVVREVARSLRPGGRFAVMDYFHYEALTLEPRSPALDRVVEAVVASWRDSGGDLDIAGKLPAIFDSCGLDVSELRPVVHVARPGEILWEWPRRFFHGYVPKLVEMGHLSEDESRAFREEWAAIEAAPHSFFLTPPMMLVTGTKRA